MSVSEVERDSLEGQPADTVMLLPKRGQQLLRELTCVWARFQDLRDALLPRPLTKNGRMLVEVGEDRRARAAAEDHGKGQLSEKTQARSLVAERLASHMVQGSPSRQLIEAEDSICCRRRSAASTSGSGGEPSAAFLM